MITELIRNRKKTHLSGYLCQDDYGDAVFKCRFTDDPVVVSSPYRICGSIVPNVNICYLAKAGTESLEKQSRDWFNESEANCNTCKHFQRLPYDKREFNISGVFYGNCKLSKKPDGFMVAPDDWMGMECWAAR